MKLYFIDENAQKDLVCPRFPALVNLGSLGLGPRALPSTEVLSISPVVSSGTGQSDDARFLLLVLQDRAEGHCLERPSQKN